METHIYLLFFLKSVFMSVLGPSEFGAYLAKEGIQYVQSNTRIDLIAYYVGCRSYAERQVEKHYNDKVWKSTLQSSWSVNDKK